MKKISWITDDCFVDVDLPIIAELSKQYIIYWQVVTFLTSSSETRYLISRSLKYTGNVDVIYRNINHKPWDPRVVPTYVSILKNAKKQQPDLYYTSCYAVPYGSLLYRLILPLKKCVAACHNVSTPKGANRELYAKINTRLWLSTFKNIQVFSQNQKELLLSIFPNKNVLLAPLAIKDYGEPAEGFVRNNKTLCFLYFGIISEYKRVDLLIKAACELYESGLTNFKVIIAGKCGVWEEKYQRLIKYPQLFDLRIKRIPNEDVANLFSEGDYFVMPYQDIAQSGAITVAFRYQIPVIASNISQFNEFLNDGVDGLMFESGNSSSLANQMRKVINGGKKFQEELISNQKQFVAANFSIEAICKKYTDFLNSL